MEHATWEPLDRKVTRESEPHRWTFEGQKSPWCEPIPPVGPLFAPPSLTSGGLCPALMRDIVEILISRGRLSDARMKFDRCARDIATLGREDWDAWIASVPPRLEAQAA